MEMTSLDFSIGTPLPKEVTMLESGRKGTCKGKKEEWGEVEWAVTEVRKVSWVEVRLSFGVLGRIEMMVGGTDEDGDRTQREIVTVWI